MSPQATGVVMCRLKDVFTARPPEQLAVCGIEPDHAVGGERHDLLHAGQRGDDRARVAGNVVLRLPEDLAVGLVEADDARPMPPADADDDPLAVDQRRAGVAVAAGALGVAFFADEHGVEILDEVDPPEQLAVGRIEARNSPRHDCTKTRGPSTTGVPRGPVPMPSLITSSIGTFHSSLPVGEVVGAERLFFVAVIEAEDAPLGHGGRADAFAQLDLPEQFRLGGKRRGNGRAGRHPAGILRPSPARPIGGRGDGSEEDETRQVSGRERRSIMAGWIRGVRPILACGGRKVKSAGPLRDYPESFQPQIGIEARLARNVRTSRESRFRLRVGLQRGKQPGKLS